MEHDTSPPSPRPWFPTASPPPPGLIVQQAGRPEQRVLRATLGSIADAARAHGVRPPAIVIVGDVAALNVTAASLAASVTAA